MRFLHCKSNEHPHTNEVSHATPTSPECADTVPTPDHFPCHRRGPVAFGLRRADRRGDSRGPSNTTASGTLAANATSVTFGNVTVGTTVAPDRDPDQQRHRRRHDFPGHRYRHGIQHGGQRVGRGRAGRTEPCLSSSIRSAHRGQRERQHLGDQRCQRFHAFDRAWRNGHHALCDHHAAGEPDRHRGTNGNVHGRRHGHGNPDLSVEEERRRRSAARRPRPTRLRRRPPRTTARTSP